MNLFCGPETDLWNTRADFRRPETIKICAKNDVLPVVVYHGHGDERRRSSGPVVVFGVQAPEGLHGRQIVGVIVCPSPQDVALVADHVRVISGEISPRADPGHPVGKFTLWRLPTEYICTFQHLKHLYVGQQTIRLTLVLLSRTKTKNKTVFVYKINRRCVKRPKNNSKR